MSRYISQHIVVSDTQKVSAVLDATRAIFGMWNTTSRSLEIQQSNLCVANKTGILTLDEEVCFVITEM